jgi:hypothetical protein
MLEDLEDDYAAEQMWKANKSSGAEVTPRPPTPLNPVAPRPPTPLDPFAPRPPTPLDPVAEATPRPTFESEGVILEERILSLKRGMGKVIVKGSDINDSQDNVKAFCHYTKNNITDDLKPIFKKVVMLNTFLKMVRETLTGDKSSLMAYIAFFRKYIPAQLVPNEIKLLLDERKPKLKDIKYALKALLKIFLDTNTLEAIPYDEEFKAAFLPK